MAEQGSGSQASLAGSVALVTGASTGIGRALAEGLAARGASLAGLARGAERLSAELADIAAATGSRTLAVAADVTDLAAVRAAVARVEAELGPIDLLVNNAGLVDAAEVPIWTADPDQWWAVVESQVRGPFHLVQAVVPGMVARGSGRMIDLASGMSTRSHPDYTAYSVGKTGQLRITEALAVSGRDHGVRAFDVAPGVVDTPMTRSMAMWAGYQDWTPVSAVVDLVVAIAEGRLDAWTGRFLRAGADSLPALLAHDPEGVQRQVRLLPYGEDDPIR